jgi:hypothetical protein
MARASARTSIPLDEAAATGTFEAFAAFAQLVGFIAHGQRTDLARMEHATVSDAHIEEPGDLRCGISAGVALPPAIISGVNS